jgi:hypothetical protein
MYASLLYNTSTVIYLGYQRSFYTTVCLVKRKFFFVSVFEDEIYYFWLSVQYRCHTCLFEAGFLPEEARTCSSFSGKSQDAG